MNLTVLPISTEQTERLFTQAQERWLATLADEAQESTGPGDWGYFQARRRIWVLRHRSPFASPTGAWQFLPARAALRSQEEFLNELHPGGLLAKRMLRHLDDPHVDALLARRDGQVQAIGCLLGIGQAAWVSTLIARPGSNAAGPLLGQLLDIAARGQVRHILADSAASDDEWSALLARDGFVEVFCRQAWT